MIKLTLFLLICEVCSVNSLNGQSSHQAVLTWQDLLNPSGTTYSVYRGSGLCSGSPIFSQLVQGVSQKTYTDTTVTPGNYCFYVTATFSAIESAHSNFAFALVPSFPPTSLSLSVAWNFEDLMPKRYLSVPS